MPQNTNFAHGHCVNVFRLWPTPRHTLESITPPPCFPHKPKPSRPGPGPNCQRSLMQVMVACVFANLLSTISDMYDTFVLRLPCYICFSICPAVSVSRLAPLYPFQYLPCSFRFNTCPAVSISVLALLYPFQYLPCCILFILDCHIVFAFTIYP